MDQKTEFYIKDTIQGRNKTEPLFSNTRLSCMFSQLSHLGFSITKIRLNRKYMYTVLKGVNSFTKPGLKCPK